MEAEVSGSTVLSEPAAQSTSSTETTRLEVKESTCDCDCGFKSCQENNAVNFPVRMRAGGTLARTLYRKTMVDQELRGMDKRQVTF